jgi:acetylornithine deacetylase/succinyl-diaminopimelate desuccinylase-like protein
MLGQDGDLQAGLRLLEEHLQDIMDEAMAICRVPAPTFHEARRAAHVLKRMEALDLGVPRMDDAGDVICELPGNSAFPAVVLMAHLDTVFDLQTPLQVRRDGTMLYGPGVGDNSMALAALLWLGRALLDLPGRGTLIMAANVGEEGLGNLRGAKALWERYGQEASAWVVLEGATFNRAARVGVCSRRLSITYRTTGGHSWKDFGRPNAIHALGRLIDQIAQIRVPADPRTTYNVGVVRGGTTVNTIAAEAGLVLDMRSEDPEALTRLDRAVRTLAGAVAEAAGVEPTVEIVGDRPGGALPPDHPLVALVEETSAALGVPVTWEAASTDTNVPLSHGAAAVCLGIARGENLHTVDEVLDVADALQGLQQAYLVVAALLRGRRDSRDAAYHSSQSRRSTSQWVLAGSLIEM